MLFDYNLYFNKSTSTYTHLYDMVIFMSQPSHSALCLCLTLCGFVSTLYRSRTAGGGSRAEPRRRRPCKDEWASEEAADLQPDSARTLEAQQAVRARCRAAPRRQHGYMRLYSIWWLCRNSLTIWDVRFILFLDKSLLRRFMPLSCMPFWKIKVLSGDG